MRPLPRIAEDLCVLYAFKQFIRPTYFYCEIRLDRESDEVMLSAGDWLTTSRPDDM